MADRVAQQRVRALFVTPTWMATGETAAALVLADSIVAGGGEAWFLASGPAAQILRPKFGDRVQEMTGDLASNQHHWRRMVEEVEPNVVVFSELRSILALRLNRQYPLADLSWLRELNEVDALLVALDHVGSTPSVQKVMGRLSGHAFFRLISNAWRPIFERMVILLPCPLHEPGKVEGRQGHPYRSMAMPARLDPAIRAQVRARYLGEDDAEDGRLIFHSVPRWSYRLAKALKAPLYEHLSEILAEYVADVEAPVTIVSVNDGTLLRRSPNKALRVVNLAGLPLAEFDALMLSSDMVLTENIVSLTLAKTVGNAPGVAFVNTSTLKEILAREPEGSEIRRLALQMERTRAGSVYPHVMYPIKQQDKAGAAAPSRRRLFNAAAPSLPMPEEMIRAGSLPSSPFIRAELYGGQATRDLFRGLLTDPARMAAVRAEDEAFIARQNALEDGSDVLKRLLSGRTVGDTVIAHG
ncbi:MAG TPA: DUF6365 family protein [Candidatus Binatia bacterium]|nr:DUF6365 family protein [Candidatus Binatia bacterium]